MLVSSVGEKTRLPDDFAERYFELTNLLRGSAMSSFMAVEMKRSCSDDYRNRDNPGDISREHSGVVYGCDAVHRKDGEVAGICKFNRERYEVYANQRCMSSSSSSCVPS